MKLFISWSGRKSELIAIELRNWLSKIVNSLDIWISVKDISVGDRWYLTLSKALEESSIGLICLTRENLNSNWVLFEAGAISKAVEKSRLIPLLIDLTEKDLNGPLSFFQAISFKKVDLYNFLFLLNQQNEINPKSKKVLNTYFEKTWPELEQKFEQINTSSYPVYNEKLRIISTRELSIILLLQEEKSLEEIAKYLMVSIGTVHTHIRRLYHKLGATSKDELVRFA